MKKTKLINFSNLQDDALPNIDSAGGSLVAASTNGVEEANTAEAEAGVGSAQEGAEEEGEGSNRSGGEENMDIDTECTSSQARLTVTEPSASQGKISPPVELIVNHLSPLRGDGQPGRG